MTNMLTVDQAAVITHGGLVATLASVTLHFNELAILFSSVASLAGVVLQFWLAFGKLKRLEEKQTAQDVASKINSARVGAVEDRQTFQEIKPPPIVVVPVSVTSSEIK